MRVRCPHCRSPIEIVDDAELSDIPCPTCGSSFSLVVEDTLTHDTKERTVAHFRLTEKLGVGAFGTVWKATDTQLDRTVAIKIPRKTQLDAQESEQFLREARAAAQLRHPNIVTVHEVGRDDGQVYIVSDYIQGATLSDWIEDRQLSPREAAEWCTKIAGAMITLFLGQGGREQQILQAATSDLVARETLATMCCGPGSTSVCGFIQSLSHEVDVMSVHLSRIVLVGCLILIRGWTALSAQEIGGAKAGTKRGPGARNIYTGKSDLETGRQLMLAQCSLCHGVDGRGGRGPDLVQGTLRHGTKDKEIFDSIKNGVPGTDMVGRGSDDRTIWQIVAFIQSQRKNVKPAIVTGDPVAGSGLFAQHKCSTCHWTGGDGGRQGPDLRKSRSTVEYVKSAIVDPNRKVDPRYWKVGIVTRDGRISQGLRLDEDSYHIQFIDSEEKLHTVPKSAIAEIRVAEESLMASYGKELNPRQLEDLIAYLFSLREE